MKVKADHETKEFCLKFRWMINLAQILIKCFFRLISLRWTGMFEYHLKRQSSRGKIFAMIASPAELQTELLVR